MNEFDPRFTPDQLMRFCLDAIHEIRPDDLAYLFATGKSELELLCESFSIIEENPVCFKTLDIELKSYTHKCFSPVTALKT